MVIKSEFFKNYDSERDAREEMIINAVMPDSEYYLPFNADLMTSVLFKTRRI